MQITIYHLPLEAKKNDLQLYLFNLWAWRNTQDVWEFIGYSATVQCCSKEPINFNNMPINKTQAMNEIRGNKTTAGKINEIDGVALCKILQCCRWLSNDTSIETYKSFSTPLTGEKISSYFKRDDENIRMWQGGITAERFVAWRVETPCEM